MDVSWVAAPVLLLLLLLLEGTKEVRAAGAGVSCYKCSYYTHAGTTVPQDCIEVADCTFCQTRVYWGDSTELVQRDCVARCLSSGVPVIFKDLKDVSADEICCTSDLCNIHPSSAAPSIRALNVLTLFPILLLTTRVLT